MFYLPSLVDLVGTETQQFFKFKKKHILITDVIRFSGRSSCRLDVFSVFNIR